MSYKKERFVEETIEYSLRCDLPHVTFPVEPCSLPLDAISPEIAAAARMAKWWRRAADCRWGKDLLEILDGGGGTSIPWASQFGPEMVGWCGWDGTLIPPLISRDGEIIAALTAMGLGTEVSGSGRGRSFGKVRRTPKDDEVARIVMNLRELNSHCGRPPRFSLPGPVLLVRVLSFFGSNSFFVSWDYRHWYYQLPLAKRVSFLFAFMGFVEKRRMMVEMRSWCMGFSWTPYVGQATVVAGVMEIGIKRLGLAPWSPTVFSSETIPPAIAWMIPGTTEVVAFSVMWADNGLVVCPSETWAERWKSAIVKECDTLEARIRIKDPGVTISRDRVLFVGVDWSVIAKGQMGWVHCEKNRKKWRALLDAVPTRRNVARLCGIAYWDNTILGTRLGRIRDVVEMSRIISCQVSIGGDWDTELVVGADKLRRIRDLIRVTSDREDPVSTSVPSVPEAVVWLNSDAMSNRLAGTRLIRTAGGEVRTNLILRREFSVHEWDLHINIKETLAAVETVWQWLAGKGPASFPGPRAIVLGLDNKTAVKALSLGFYPGREEVSGRIWAVLRAVEDLGYVLVVVFVPGIFQVADEPSRNAGSASSLKCLKCLAIMQETFEAQVGPPGDLPDLHRKRDRAVDGG